jgi:DNA-binding transcriptional MerR regulator
MKGDQLDGVYRVQAFADLAGVTVRALHHYDRLALLRPKRTRAGYRVYSVADLERLEQIVALKFLGLPLKQIKAVLDRDTRSLVEVLRAQRRALEEKRRRLDKAIDAIADAEASILPGQPPASAVLQRVIEVIEMNDQPDDMKKYYNDEAWADVLKRRGEFNDKGGDAALEGTRRWRALYADIRESLDADPAGAVAQALLHRWKALVDEFTGGNRGIEDGVRRAWQDGANWGESMRKNMEPFRDPRVWDFIHKAREARR